MNSEKPVVLSVEDDIDVQALIQLVLDEAGYRVVCARSALEAVEMLGDAPPDIVLLDIAMPGVDGVDACKALRRMPAAADVPIVFVTARSGTEDRERAASAGGSGYLVKPFTAEQLVDTVRHHVRARLATPATAPETRPARHVAPRAATAIRTAVAEAPVMTDEVLLAAVRNQASDVLIEPSADGGCTVLIRVDGEPRRIGTLTREAGEVLVSRLKALGGLDIAEHRRPQHGSIHATVEGRHFHLVLSTAPTAEGEGLSVRLSEPDAPLGSMSALGIAEVQASAALAYLTRVRGLLLVAGPPASGKTVTASALLSDASLASRRIVSVEDPVEYKIPRANQQQVDARSGATWEALVEGSLLQGPDILYLGHLRDATSVEMVVRSSLDHLVVACIDAPNATAALQRLERLGIDRATIAEAAPLVLAVRLARRLCPQCRSIGNVTEPEIDLISPYTHDIPFRVAQPVGCPECGGSGFQGRRAVSEVVQVEGEIASRVRSGESFDCVRNFARGRGDALFGQVAVEGVRAFTFSPEEIRRAVLADDDLNACVPAAPASPGHAATLADASPSVARILVAEDDADTRDLVSHILSREGYEVVTADNGADALYQLGSGRFELVITDIGMPMLDGLDLMRVMAEKSLDVPVVVLTARQGEDATATGYRLGATDYITKPVVRSVLVSRVSEALEKRGSAG